MIGPFNHCLKGGYRYFPMFQNTYFSKQIHFITGHSCIEFNSKGRRIQESFIKCKDHLVPCPYVYNSTEAYKCKILAFVYLRVVDSIIIHIFWKVNFLRTEEYSNVNIVWHYHAHSVCGEIKDNSEFLTLNIAPCAPYKK